MTMRLCSLSLSDRTALLLAHEATGVLADDADVAAFLDWGLADGWPARQDGCDLPDAALRLPVHVEPDAAYVWPVAAPGTEPAS